MGNPSSNQKIALILGSTLFILCTLELGVRLARGKLFDASLLSVQYSPVDNDNQTPPAQYDELLGWIPNYGIRQDGGKLYTIVDGNIRSNGPGQQDSHGRRKILVAGDSFAFGYEVNDHEAWPSYLEDLLNNRMASGSVANYQVINGGVSGYGMDQIVLRAEQLAKEHKPELVILSFIPDDVLRGELSVRQRAKPYFIVRKEQLVLENTPVPLPRGIWKSRDLDSVRRVLGYSHLIDLVVRRYYWLNVNGRVVLTQDLGLSRAGNGSGIQIGCLLMERLRTFRDEHDFEALVVAQYERFLRDDSYRIAKELLVCARENNLHTLDLYLPLKRVKLRGLSGFPNKTRGSSGVCRG